MLPNEPDFPDLRSVMDLSWANGLQQARTENNILKAMHEDIFRDNLPHSFDSISEIADKKDKLKLLTPINGNKTFNADANLYKYTLDRFLLNYYDLIEYHDRNYESSITLDSTTQISISNFKNRSHSVRKRTLLKLDALKQKKKGNGDCILIGGAPAVYINLFNWYHMSNLNVKRIVNPLAFYGVRYSRSNAVSSGPFHLEDYILHEMITHVSLVLEITAILLEFENKEIRDKAWHTFLTTPYETCSYCSVDGKDVSCSSPTMFDAVFGSNLLYTRIVVARSFFRTILIATELKKYVPYLSDTDQLFCDDEWDMLVHNAFHAELLNYDFPERGSWNAENCEECLKYVKSLLSDVISPASYTGPKAPACPTFVEDLSVMNYANQATTPEHLAMFHNRQHPYVAKLTDCLYNDCAYPETKPSTAKLAVFFNQIYKDVLKELNYLI